MSEMVEVDKGELEGLREDSQFLRALQAAGVDNYICYENAQDIVAEWNEED